MNDPKPPPVYYKDGHFYEFLVARCYVSTDAPPPVEFSRADDQTLWDSYIDIVEENE